MYSGAEFKSRSDFAIKRELKWWFYGAVVVQSQGTRDQPVNKFKIICSWTNEKLTKIKFHSKPGQVSNVEINVDSDLAIKNCQVLWFDNFLDSQSQNVYGERIQEEKD